MPKVQPRGNAEQPRTLDRARVVFQRFLGIATPEEARFDIKHRGRQSAVIAGTLSAELLAVLFGSWGLALLAGLFAYLVFHEYSQSWLRGGSPRLVGRGVAAIVLTLFLGFAARHQLSAMLLPQLPESATVVVGVAVGSNDQMDVAYSGSEKDPLTLAYQCSPPFKCYTPEMLKDEAVPLVLTKEGWGRIFFRVANTSGQTIPNPEASLFVLDKPVVRIDFAPYPHQPDRQPQSSLTVPVTRDILPLRTSEQLMGYAFDLTPPMGIDRFAVQFKIRGSNLKANYTLVKVRVQRPPSAQP